MRKEAVNTFNEGLNFDLNPLTTPNNVLTDCVNGTFITFNGDELALQNDAGNIRIIIPDENATEHSLLETYDVGDKVYVYEDKIKIYYENLTGINSEVTNTTNWDPCFVKLSEGFYPIGIKEYGGVLYIVSGKKPDDLGIQWIAGTYAANSVVYNEVDSIKHYYISKQITSEPLPVESDDYWLYVGTEKDYINEYGEVEFGSYPSPEAIGITSFDGIELYNYTTTNPTYQIENILYNPKIINNNIFKTGRKVVFDQYLSLDSTYISRYEYSGGVYTYTPKFYKVKLWHQLNNGFMDLTDYVWDDYIKYKGTSITGNFWFNDPTFEFYCPTQYKGKLAISVEIEELSEFALDGPPEIEFDTSLEEYTFTLFVKAVGIGDIAVPKVKVETWTDSGYYNTQTISTDIGNVATYATILGIAYKDQVINYKITPILSVNSVEYLEEIPDEYINKFILIGSRLLTTAVDAVRLLLGAYECLSPDPYKRYNEIILTDINGDYIDINLDIVEVPHVFLMTGETPTDPSSVIVQYYTLTGNNALLVDDQSLDLQDIPEMIIDLVNSTVVIQEEESCGIVDLTIELSSELRDLSEISVIQLGSTITPESGSTLKIITFKVSPNVSLKLSVGSMGYKNINSSFTITENTWRVYALIANVLTSAQWLELDRYLFKATWNEDRPLISGVIRYDVYRVDSSNYRYKTSSIPIQLTFNGTNYYGDVNGKLQATDQVGWLEYIGTDGWEQPVVAGEFYNIVANETAYIKINGIVFEKGLISYRK